MHYRRFGNTDIMVSALGLGCMRLPEQETKGVWSVDLPAAQAVIDKAVSLGINYFDAAYGYCHGNCEAALGKLLQPYRKQVYLSTKMPLWHVKGPEDFDRIFAEQLTRLQTDYIDFYHFHAVNKSLWKEKVLNYGLLDKMLHYKNQGAIRHISFSFHDDFATMKEIIDTSIFSTVLCQYNLLDRSCEKGMAYAVSKGMGVAVMGPVGGGRLEHPTPELNRFLLKKESTLPDTALKFVWSNPHVSLALSGMNSAEMVEQNVQSMEQFRPFTSEEQNKLLQISEEFQKMADLYCTGCEYCQPCPKGIDIPEVFRALIYQRVYGLTQQAKERFAPLQEKTAQCIACHQCEGKCPQRIPIVERLHQALQELG